MPYIVCDRASKTIVHWVRHGTLPVDAGHIGFAIDREVDRNNEVWDGATGLRPKSQAEKDAEKEAQKDRAADLNDNVLRALALVLLDIWNGAAPPTTPNQLKQAIKAKL